MKKLNYLTGFFLLAGLISLQATAAEENNEQGVYDLGEIIVSTEATGVEAIGTVREVTAEEIEMSGAETLDEALRLLPGISMKVGGQGVPRPDLRGMKPRHVTLLINGIPFNSAGDGQFDPRLITTENIAKIKVSYGNDSVLYGPGGLGGVINVITKNGTGKMAFDVEGKYADRDQTTLKAILSGGNSKVNYFVSANDYSSDGYTLSDDFVPTSDRDGVLEDGGIRNNSDEELRSFFGSISVSPNDISEFGLTANYIEGEYGIPASTITRRIDPVFGKNFNRYERVEDREGLSLSLSGKYDVPGPLNLRGWVYINDLEESRNQYSRSDFSPGNSTLEKTTIKGANLQSQYVTQEYGTVSLSIATKEESFESTGLDRDIKTHSVSVEYEVSPVEKMGLVAGYGYSWFKKEGNSDSTGSYLIGLNYNFTEDTSIRASAADKVRFPSVTQLYDFNDAGNPDLTYEKSMNYELGFEHNISSIKTAFSITGFRRDVENYIAKIEVDNGEETIDLNMNHDEYMFQGIEITASNRSIDNLYVGLGYTYMDTEDKSPGSLVDDLQYNPKHKFTLAGQYNFAYDISAYASIERVESQYYYNSDNTAKGELPDFTIVNLKVEKKLFSKALKIYAGANNIFDENYFESFALPREGRSIYGGIKYSF